MPASPPLLSAISIDDAIDDLIDAIENAVDAADGVLDDFIDQADDIIDELLDLEVENAPPPGITADYFFGGDGIDWVTGEVPDGAGEPIDGAVLYGGGEADRLTGTAENDLLLGASGADRLSGLGGIDVLVGATGADTVLGGAGKDGISGDSGDDRLDGGGGRDVIHGGGDRDTVIGGLGADVLDGGRHADRFLFRTVEETGSGDTRDVVIGFRSGVDKIVLGPIDADAQAGGDQDFIFVGADPFTDAGQVRFSGGRLLGNVDDDAAAELVIRFFDSDPVVAGDIVL
jgi:Ca2+-binding RTX toxin-like protein